jgi:hypothetical protein
VASIVPFQDFNDDDDNIEFRRRRWKYWQGLKTTRLEYMNSLIPLGKKFDERDFKNYIEEDGVVAVAGPTNNVGSGSIAGTGGKGGEPGVNLKKKNRVVMAPTFTRKPPTL